MAAIYLATRKPKLVSAVHLATSVSVTGSANRATIYPNMTRLISRAPAPTIRGILLQRALRFATTTKSGK